MNANWFEIAMLAYNLNCWLELFSCEENVSVDAMKHTTLAIARLLDCWDRMDLFFRLKIQNEKIRELAALEDETVLSLDNWNSPLKLPFGQNSPAVSMVASLTGGC